MDNQAAAPGPSTALSSEPVSQPNQPSTIGVLDEFQTELAIYWHRLPNKAFFFTLLFAWLALFHFRGNSILGYIHSSSLFAWMSEAYNSANTESADDKIGNFIPFLVLGLFWVKRRQLLEAKPGFWFPGLLLMGLAVFFHVIGYIIQEPRVSIVALFTGIYGLMALAWGWKWIVNCFFPFFLFIFCIPLGNHSDLLTTRLQLLVCWLVEKVSDNILGIGVIRQGALLFDSAGAYQYEVAAACSGIRSLFTIFLLATVYGFLTFRSTWKRLFVMSLAIPFAVLGNLIRMMLIIVAASMFGQKSGDWVHENGLISLIPYIPAIMGLLWAGSLLEKRPEKKVSS